MNYNKGIYVKFARCFYFEIPTKGERFKIDDISGWAREGGEVGSPFYLTNGH